jgi:hypothetical protein
MLENVAGQCNKNVCLHCAVELISARLFEEAHSTFSLRGGPEAQESRKGNSSAKNNKKKW